MEDPNNSQNDQTAVIMVPLPAQGHLNQLLHLSHHLTSYNIPVHYVGSSIHNRQAKLRIQGWDPDSLNKVKFHDFNIPSYILPSPDLSVITPLHLRPLFDAWLHLREPICQLLQELATEFKRVIVIHDISISSMAQDVQSIPNAEAYMFLPISAFSLFCYTWEALSVKPFQLDFEVPTSAFLPSPREGFAQEMVEFMTYQQKFMDFQSGKLYNTCRVIEGKYVELMEKLSMDQNVKHFSIGPFNPVEIKNTSNKQRHGCLEWLDKQERDSVIYISFGSMTTISEEQIRELAEGLERSGQKFIWVLRNADKGDIFEEDQVRKLELPKGYEERIRNRGIVVRDWAPQLEILAHGSTGGFMSHCGWNSCLESISFGVPIAAWPMHSDQPKNSVLVTEVLRSGIMVRDRADQEGVVTSNAIAKAVIRLMATEEGTEMRKRAAELGDKVRNSVAKGGASHSELELFIAHITR